MNSDLGVWTSQDCALVLIDYQKEIFATIRSETSADLVELNVRLLGQDRQGVQHADRAVHRCRRGRLQWADAPGDSLRAARRAGTRPDDDERVRGSPLP